MAIRRAAVLGFVWLLACSEQPNDAELDIVTAAGDAGPNEPANLANCEPGLHPVAQRVEVFDDDGSSSCAFAPIGPYVCIRGICGDGICEAPEAVECGCTLDCRI